MQLKDFIPQHFDTSVAPTTLISLPGNDVAMCSVLCGCGQPQVQALAHHCKPTLDELHFRPRRESKGLRCLPCCQMEELNSWIAEWKQACQQAHEEKAMTFVRAHCEHPCELVWASRKHADVPVMFVMMTLVHLKRCAASRAARSMPPCLQSRNAQNGNDYTCVRFFALRGTLFPAGEV